MLAVLDLQHFYCAGVADPSTLRVAFDGKLNATAEILLDSKIHCDSNGQKTLACGTAWVDAQGFAKVRTRSVDLVRWHPQTGLLLHSRCTPTAAHCYVMIRAADGAPAVGLDSAEEGICPQLGRGHHGHAYTYHVYHAAQRTRLPAAS